MAVKRKLGRAQGFSHALKAKKIESEQIKIFFVRNTSKGARLGIIVRKKIFPTSVKRNRIKRVIREAFRKHAIGVKQVDLVVLAKVYDGSTRLNNELQVLLSKIESKCADL